MEMDSFKFYEKKTTKKNHTHTKNKLSVGVFPKTERASISHNFINIRLRMYVMILNKMRASNFLI